MKALLVALLFLSALPAQAGQEGNGGDVIVCADGSVMLLDRYEADQMRGIVFDDSLVGANAVATVANALQRYASIDSLRASAYQSRLNEFMSQTRFVNDAGLIDIPDSQHLNVPTGCSVKQAAVQRKPVFPQDPFYVIDNTIWQALSVKDQAGLILHEIVYREAIEAYQHTNSVRARYFNTLITSTLFPSLTPATFSEALKAAGFTLSGFAYSVGAKTYRFLYTREEKECAQFGWQPAVITEISQMQSLYPGIVDWLKNFRSHPENPWPGSTASAKYALKDGSLADIEVVFSATAADWRWQYGESEYVLCE